MTKGAIEQMTRVLSKDLARKGITVNVSFPSPTPTPKPPLTLSQCVAPGPTATDLFLEGKSEGLLKMLAGASPHNRIGEPSEIASVVGFLSGEDSKWVTGQTLKVNGGMA